MFGFAKETTASNSPATVAEFKEGVKHLKNGYPQKALEKLQSAFESDKNNPFYISFLGVSIARARQNWTQAAELCGRAIQLNPKEIQFHLNLGEVYALAGQSEKVPTKLDLALGLFCGYPSLNTARSQDVKTRE